MGRSFGDITDDMFAAYLQKMVANETGRVCQHPAVELQTADGKVMVFTLYGGDVDVSARVIHDNNKRLPVFTATCPDCGWMHLFSAQHVLDKMITLGIVDAETNMESDNNGKA
jgi:hypothetical protein